MEEWFIWFKALHVISVIAWMAGMLYLPRLFAYHVGAEPGSKQSEDFKIMERKLLRGIINPSMIAAWVFGYLAAKQDDAPVFAVQQQVGDTPHGDTGELRVPDKEPYA